ncbi:hypothetical protein MTF65_06795 [Streptomyces sp. APSN-46.1]|uniref:hypothetical protein n=1 Tax=Streptomyces sp. APSN-46.1 TaxID=2929049 RepID=UPI001FB3A875|nr:hypothetical protein [Streptomyces sp. APSN-46.1]MCJ1677056.1 hypothetical protein [Streptomyces sp. APSN-46.1]
MIPASEADFTIAEDTEHRLLGRDVAHPETGRRGNVVAVLVYTSKTTDKVIRRVAHMRPADGSGREWTADPRSLQPLIPLGHTNPADTR